MVQQIIQELKNKLGITEEQAKGGLGLLLKTCQEKLAAKDFSRITTMLGANWEELIKSAPAKAEGLLSKVGGLASMFGEKAAKIGIFANLASGFKSLNIDTSKIQQFVEVTITYLQEKGGPQVKEMLNKFWNKDKTKD